MGQFNGLGLAIAILDLVGSLSSFLGAGFIALCYMILPMRKHFRHSLILNLAIADFLNGLNNALSGIYVLYRRQDMSAGAGCTLNGLVGQITVQATDCCILAITVVTLLAITRKTTIGDSDHKWREVAICVSCWILPCITGFTALGTKNIGPVTGNWCWLKSNPSYLRYALTHGWRLAFIFSEIIMYAYLHIYLRKHFKNLRAAGTNGPSSSNNSHIGHETVDYEMSHGRKITTVFKDSFSSQAGGSSDAEMTAPIVHEAQSPAMEKGIISKRIEIETDFDSASTDSLPQPVITTISSKYTQSGPEIPVMGGNPFAHHRVSMTEVTKPAPANRSQSIAHSQQKSVQRILLLNAYPAAYIILWIPGILNRLVEASGHSSKILQVMQATTQFVGLANAITYGWNERIGQQLVRRFRKKHQIPLHR